MELNIVYDGFQSKFRILLSLEDLAIEDGFKLGP